MNVSSPFIRRPIATLLLMLSILLFGLIAYRFLPVSDLPNVDFPTIDVSASLPGANPDTMAASVATPLEKEFSTIAGVDSMISSSTQGSTHITLQFILSRNIEDAAADVQAAIARAARRLPEGMPNPPSYRKTNPADAPVLYFALTSPNLPMSALDEIGQTMMAQRISMVDGVSQVQVYGSQKYAVRIQLDPRALAARGMGIDEVASVIAASNVNLPLGVFSGASRTASVQATGQLMEAQEFMPMLLAYHNGQGVRVRDVGQAVDSVENDRVSAWFSKGGVRQRAIVLAVQRQPGTNTVEVAKAVKALLPTFRGKLPAGVTLEILRDSSTNIQESAHDVQFTLLLTLVLVILVIFLFLRNLSATIIPSLTLPMAIVGTFAAMYLLGYSLDNLSLMALTLSVGFVVDDAIVMLENIVRHMEMGKPRLQASLDGAKEIGFTIVSMTLSLAAVFIPVLFMGGLVGKLFREFSVTIGLAVLISGAVSLTLTPMLGSRFLRDPRRVHHGRAYRVTEAGFQAMLRFYDWSLRGVLRHKLATILVSVSILGCTVYLFLISPQGFIPSEDRDQISVQTEAAQDISYASMLEHQNLLADIVQKDPDVDRFMSAVGMGGFNTGRMFLVLKPRRQRQASADEIITRLRRQFSAVPGIRAYLTNPPMINVGGRSSRAQYQYTLQGPDTGDLYAYADMLEKKIRDLPGFLDVSSDLQLRNPQVRLEINRDEAFSRGVTPMQIEDALYSAYGTRQVSTILAPNNDYQVILELLPQFQADPGLMSLLYIRASTRALVPLRSVTQTRHDVAPLSVNHSGQLPSVTVSFNLAAGVSLGTAIEGIAELTRGTMPAGIVSGFQGTAQSFQDSMASMKWLLLLAVIVIYIVLGILYESLYHPVTILSALPFAGFGALLTLWLFHVELSLYAFVGIVMLIGLVKKNGIMMIDFALSAQREEGKNAQEAIHEACLVRFRPIMMTTMAALMAGLPIAFGWGAGAEARRPLGLAVVGGLLFSQTLTLYVTPVFFVYMEKFRMWVYRLGGAATPPALPVKEEVPAEK